MRPALAIDSTELVTLRSDASIDFASKELPDKLMMIKRAVLSVASGFKEKLDLLSNKTAFRLFSYFKLCLTANYV